MEYTSLHLKTINSTNSYARELLKKGDATEGIVVLSDYQDNGRGQGSNSWISDKGKNLLMSWILYPAFLTVSAQFMLSKAVTLGICDALSVLNLDVRIKWPNDIIYKNKKLGGILIENSIQGAQLKSSIIGIGLNINQRNFPFFPFPATSLANEMEKKISVQEVTEILLPFLRKRYLELKDGLHADLNTQYLDKLFRINLFSEFESEGKRFKGSIKGVNEFGELEVDVSGKIRTFGFHTIRMIPWHHQI